MTTGTARALAIAFKRGLAVRLASRSEELPFGLALFQDRVPGVWDLNKLWVDDEPEPLTAAALAAEADRLQGAAGLLHREVVVADEVAGERLAPGFTALGWEAARHILMAHMREPDRPAGPPRVEEIDLETIMVFTEKSVRQMPADFSEETMHQPVEAKRLLAGAGARFFGARVGDSIVSACDLYSDGRIAQIEDVMTLEEHRGQGLARAVVLRALGEARAAGSQLVFLEAEEDDWPKELYARLGFDTIGATSVFVRKP